MLVRAWITIIDRVQPRKILPALSVMKKFKTCTTVLTVSRNCVLHFFSVYDKTR